MNACAYSKKSSWFSLTAGLALLGGVCLAAEPAALVPKPLKAEWTGGTFTLSKKVKLGYLGEGAQAEAAMLASQLNPATGYGWTPVAAKSAKDAQFLLALDPALEPTLGKEGYLLEVTKKGIQIRAAAAAGLFYGGQSLRQLLPPAIYATTVQTGVKWVIPCGKIEDQPRFGWRSFMLDFSRHFSDLDTAKRLVDSMAMHKLNLLHMHLADDEGWRIEIKKYPKLTEIGAWRGTKCALPNPAYMKAEANNERYGGFFTQDQIRDLIAYAAARHVNLMPEIDLPGHSLALVTAYPETAPTKVPDNVKSAQGFKGNAISPAKEANYAMVDDIMGELAALFPFEYIHIGGDEVNHDLWKTCPEIKGLIEREQLGNERGAQVYFTKRLEGILAKHHKKMIGWNEILNEKLQRTTAIMSWVGTGPGYQAARMGFPVVMAPGPHCYFDMSYPQSNDEPPGHSWAGVIDAARCYAFEPLAEKGLTPEQAKQIMGVQACLWCEYITPWKSKSGWGEWPTMWDAIGFKVFPRLCALAEMGWTAKDLRSYPEFADRLGVNLQRLKNAGVPFRMPPPAAVVRDGRIEIVPPFANAKVVYTLDGSDPFSSASAKTWDGKPLAGEPAQFRARTFNYGQYSPLHVGARIEPFAAVTTQIPCNGDDHAPGAVADKDLRTFFWSNRAVRQGETVTVTFKEPMTLTHIEAPSGMPGNAGRDALAQGELALSEEGTTFRKVADFANGVAKADLPQPTKVKAVRVTVGADQEKWMILQDLVLR